MIAIELIKEYLLITELKLKGLFMKIPPIYKTGGKGDILIIIGINENWNFFKTVSDNLNE